MSFARSDARTQSVRACLAGLLALIALTAGAASAAAQDAATAAVAHWNDVASRAFTPTQGTNPLVQSRTYAMLHAALHDTLNAIDPRYAPYTPGLTLARRASIEAALAAAARGTLVALVPDQLVLIENAYAEALARVAEGPAKAGGIAVGQAAALATLTRREHDGLDGATLPVYTPRAAAGDYQFTPPFDVALLPGWGRMMPFAIRLKDHRLPGPLPLTSVLYARDLHRIRKIGGANSSSRTEEQSQIAQFWYEDSPLGWNRIANTVVLGSGMGAWEAARMFALMNFAMADGFIAGFDAKYRFRFWRPVTAIHEAGRDANPFTSPDPTWQPFLTTPPVPDYPSTHTVLGAAAAQVLIHFFGDKVRYSASSLTLPGVTRHFRGFSQAAKENGRSRIYAGIHFPYAVTHGYQQGKSIGRAAARALPRIRP
jgi:hypothetical protein